MLHFFLLIFPSQCFFWKYTECTVTTGTGRSLGLLYTTPALFSSWVFRGAASKLMWYQPSLLWLQGPRSSETTGNEMLTSKCWKRHATFRDLEGSGHLAGGELFFLAKRQSFPPAPFQIFHWEVFFLKPANPLSVANTSKSCAENCSMMWYYFHL